ncbi:MAG TPA: AarF/UbiB family protein [Myxococcota bacterium]|jgi:predicted unusual protein kinase regulating ubiquinone biosynthesis (AarF/ABC1/UbiB family)|nr:AarF/UbiB family protein [Myxococcota bacterium]
MESTVTESAPEETSDGSPAAALPAVTPLVTGVGRPLRPRRFRARTSGWGPAWRITACGVGALGTLALGAVADLFVGAAARSGRREARRARLARRVARLLGELKGPFVKAGQFAALRYDALPPDARQTFEALQDRVPALPFDDVCAVLEEDLAGRLETRFAAFEPEPLGAASVAQVHRARLHDGREVAVKVQHPWLAESLAADVALLRLLFRLWLGFTRRAPAGAQRGVDRERLFQEFSAGLAEELDFEREAAVATEIAANLSSDPQIVVPRVVASHSTRRVLTMSYHPAVPILDRDRLEALGVRPRDVLEVLARAYAKQVFVDGVFHADPHPGNLFVLDEPEAGARPRVLFVDFGLSKRLSPELRRELRLGIYALLQRDLDAFVGGMQRMTMIAPGAEGAVRAAVASMFERMAGGGASPLGLSGAGVMALKDEAKLLLQSTPGLQLPNDLLLYAKTLSYLFALGERLDPEVDLMKLTVPYLLKFLATRDD